MFSIVTNLRRSFVFFKHLKTVTQIKPYNVVTKQYKNIRIAREIPINCKYTATTTLCGVLTFLGLQDNTEDGKESVLVTTIKRSILLIQKEEFAKAEQMLHLALKIAQEQNNADGITYVYDVMANLAYDTGDYKKAEKLFLNVMQRIISEGTAEDDNKVIHISLKLAQIYANFNDTEKAEDGFQFCIENLEQKLKATEKAATDSTEDPEDTFLLLAMSLDMYAHFLLAQNKISEAYGTLKKAYEKCTQVYGRHHEEVVVLLNDLGTVANMLGKQEVALRHLEEAVDIGRTLPDMKDIGSIYVNLGYLYLFQQMYNESRTACEAGRLSARKHQDNEIENEANLCLTQVKTTLNG